MQIHHNSLYSDQPEYPAELRKVVDLNAHRTALGVIRNWPGYEPTPLHHLNAMAESMGVDRIWYKDEGERFGLRSFKALGGAYAVYRLIASRYATRNGGRVPAIGRLQETRPPDLLSDLTVACATDGNHGHSVAWGAQLFGVPCVIYVHEQVSPGRVSAIEALGARVVRVAGNYDDSVRQVAEAAKQNGWQVVSDTSYGGYTDVPRDVMQGYTVMAEEVIRQLPGGELPTHVFVQGGVGGLAAAVCGHLWERLAEKRPRMVVVEPEKADCLYQSAVAGQPTVVKGTLDTVMAGLACGEVSVLAWQVLRRGVQDFVTVPDACVAGAMRRLADGRGSDPSIVAGESAVAGLCVLRQLRNDRQARQQLGIDGQSRVLLLGTEGATDPEVYRKLTASRTKPAAWLPE